MPKNLGGISGSREPNPQAVSALTGFDPGRIGRLQGLITSCEAAPGPDEELDVAICAELFPLSNGQFLLRPVTKSIDEAVHTLPKGADWRIYTPLSASAYVASPYNAAAQTRHDGFGKTIPLRICAAALKTRLEIALKDAATNARKGVAA